MRRYLTPIATVLLISALTGCSITKRDRIEDTPAGPVERTSVTVKPSLDVSYEEYDDDPFDD